MGLHVSLLLNTTDAQGLSVSIMTEKISYFIEVKNQPDRCEVSFDNGDTLTVMVSHDDFVKAIQLLEGTHLKMIPDSDVS